MTAVLLDTCAVIWLGEGIELTAAARDAIRLAAISEGVFVSPVSAWEIGMLSRPRGKRAPMVFLPDARAWLESLLALPGMRQAPLSMTAAVEASALPGDLHNDPADRLLIATARERGLPIVTRDLAILTYARAGHVHAIAC